MKKWIFLPIFLFFLFINAHASPDLIVLPVTPIPAVVTQGSVVPGLVYQVKNLNPSNTYPITFENLNGDGISYTSTCSNLAPLSTCNINMTFDSTGQSLTHPYVHPFSVLGASAPAYWVLNSKIIAPSGDVNAYSNITLSDGNTTSDTFTETFTPAVGSPIIFNTVPFGKNELSPAIAQGTYTVSITPASITVGGYPYDAPLPVQFHLAQTGDAVNLTYTKDQNISVTTSITAPNIGLSTVAVKATGAAAYGPHNQTGGSDNFDNMKPGSYTVTAGGYTGTDTLSYTCHPVNPYSIGKASTVISFSCSAIPPATESVNTIITAPNLPTGSTVAVTLAGSQTYGPHNQAAGTNFFDHVEDGSYTLTCAPYSVGSDQYTATPTNPTTIDSSHQTATCTYSKVAPPGTNFDWTVNRLATVVKNANIHAIYWGGGSTTGLVTFGNPAVNAFLNSNVSTYFTAPIATLTTAHVQNFPNYIAMGTVAIQTGAVDDQLKALNGAVSMTNKYDGNGDGNSGCAFNNQQGYQIQMTPGTGSYATPIATAQNYQIFGDYYLYSTVGYTTNLTAPNFPTENFYHKYLRKFLGVFHVKILQTGALNIKMVNTHGDTYVQNTLPGLDPVSGLGRAFDNVLPGSYTITAASYVGTDGKTYNATISNPVEVNGAHVKLTATYSIQGSTISPSATTTPQKSQNFYYDGTVNSITNTSGNNYLVTITYAQVPLHSNPNLSLIKTQALPANANISWNLTAPKIYYTTTGQVNLNIQADGLCNSIWYPSGAYTPQVNAIATQAADVQTATGHPLIGGVVMYTTRNSDSFDAMTDDVTNDYSITFYLFNLMYEGKLMQAQYPAVKMVLLLNPDSTNPFQNCTQYYCPFVWKPGITQDTVNKVIQIPNIQIDSTKAIDRMVTYGYMTSGAATTLKNLIQSSGVLVPPPSSGRTVAGVPELYLLENLLFKQLAPNVPFGYGQNIYDNSNPLMAVGTPPVAGAPWETASVGWIHKVNHLGYSSGTVTSAINFEGDKYAQFLKDMNYVSYTGDTFSQYKPDFVYCDIYERDPMPAAVGQGFLMNGVDLDTYFSYWTRIESDINMVTPLAIWQIPGASFQIQGATLPNALSGTWPDYIFGHAGLDNNMSNLDTALNYATTSFLGYFNTTVYYTSNSGVSNAEDYVKLTSSAP